MISSFESLVVALISSIAQEFGVALVYFFGSKGESGKGCSSRGYNLTFPIMRTFPPWNMSQKNNMWRFGHDGSNFPLK